MIFRRKPSEGATAVAEPVATGEALLTEIEALTVANRKERDLDRERRLLKLREAAGARLVRPDAAFPKHPKPAFESLPEGGRVPEVTPTALTAELLRAAILGKGCLLVRGMVDADEARRFADEIERAYRAREAVDSGGPKHDGYYEPFVAAPPADDLDDMRPWIAAAGGLWAADSPKLMFEMIEIFEGAGLRPLIEGYLGERAMVSVHKCTLRESEPQVPGSWHQDGRFMGDTHALNVWLSLSDCGVDAPGLDIVPRRLDDLVPTGEEMFEASISQVRAEEAAGEVGILRPTFSPGDALLFDDLFLHQTGVDPQMPNTRYAIESWFFGVSGFPVDYVPLAF